MKKQTTLLRAAGMLAVCVLVGLVCLFSPAHKIGPASAVFLRVPRAEKLSISDLGNRDRAGSNQLTRTTKPFGRYTREDVKLEIGLWFEGPSSLHMILGKRDFAYDKNWTYDLTDTSALYDCIEEQIARIGGAGHPPDGRCRKDGGAEHPSG